MDTEKTLKFLESIPECNTKIDSGNQNYNDFCEAIKTHSNFAYDYFIQNRDYWAKYNFVWMLSKQALRQSSFMEKTTKSKLPQVQMKKIFAILYQMQ